MGTLQGALRDTGLVSEEQFRKHEEGERIKHAAGETSAVSSRELLWSEGVVKISVPLDALERTYKDGDISIQYLQFPRLVGGGKINCFVHDNLSCRGEKINADVRVMKKTMKDGREYLYIDLRHTLSPITHRLAVMVSDEPGVWSKKAKKEGWVVFETPDPMWGAIILAPPDAKIVSN